MTNMKLDRGRYRIEQIWEHKSRDDAHRSSIFCDDLENAKALALADNNDPYLLDMADVIDQETGETVFHVTPLGRRSKP